MALDRDGTAEKIDRPAEPPPPPDRPGAEGAPSRAASRAAARAPDRPAEPRGTPEDASPAPSPDETGEDPCPADDTPEPSPDGDVKADGEAGRAVAVPESGGGGRLGGPGTGRASERRGDVAVAPDERPLFPPVTDHSGYTFAEREFAFAGVSPEQAWDMRTRRAPLGIRPEQWDDCVAELRAALVSDGLGDADVRLQGPGARFCSQDPGTWFPQNESELRAKVIQYHRDASDDERLRRADTAVAKYRAAGFSEGRPKPRAPFFDGMYGLELAGEPDGYEFEIVGESLAARFHDGEQSARDLEWSAPALLGWASRWTDVTGRRMTLSAVDRLLPGGCPREDDWTVVEPEDGAL